MTLKKFLTIFSAIIVVSASIFFYTSQVFACTCAAPGSPTEELKNSAAVFSGKISDRISETNSYLIDFEVTKSWKGLEGDSIRVRTAKESAACGYNFESNKEYLVYGNNLQDDVLSTNICTRTKLLSQASDDLKELGEGKPIVSQGPPKYIAPMPPPEKDYTSFIIIAAIIAIGLIAGITAFVRKK